MGYDVSNIQLSLPDTVIRHAGLYEEPSFSQIPKMMAAQAAVQVAQYQSQETKRSVYPSIYVKGSLNQALNGKNPNNNEDDGMYSSVMLEANSNFSKAVLYVPNNAQRRMPSRQPKPRCKACT